MGIRHENNVNWPSEGYSATFPSRKHHYSSQPTGFYAKPFRAAIGE